MQNAARASSRKAQDKQQLQARVLASNQSLRKSALKAHKTAEAAAPQISIKGTQPTPLV
jgi:hypothetical protein